MSCAREPCGAVWCRRFWNSLDCFSLCLISFNTGSATPMQTASYLRPHPKLFLSPVDVTPAGRAAELAIQGRVTRGLANGGQTRKQGFCNSLGKPAEYDGVLFVDRTWELGVLLGSLGGNKDKTVAFPGYKRSKRPPPSMDAPLMEGELVGKQTLKLQMTSRLTSCRWNRSMGSRRRRRACKRITD